MIVPFIFSLDPVSSMPCLWCFYKGVSFAKKELWPVIAQERYFSSYGDMPEDYAFFEQDEVCYKFDYDKPQKEDLKKITQIKIPEILEADYISSFPSQTDAYLASLKQPWEAMEKFFQKSIEIIEEKYNEKIEAFLVFQFCKFIDDVANRNKIPVIHYEWGPMRYDFYRNTAYFDWKGVCGNSNISERLKNFYSETDNTLPVFSRRELLALFLDKQYLHYATDEYGEPIYEMGIAFGYTTPTAISAFDGISAKELYAKVKKYYPEEKICVRYHPGDPLHAELRCKNEDRGNLFEFLLNCKRIACINSNVSFDAMLFNRYVYEEKWSQYGAVSNHLNEGITDKPLDIRTLNFLAFGLLVPFELLNSVEYIRFRLREKNECKIYMYHLEYYLATLQISKKIFELKENERLSLIMAIRGNEDGRRD